MALGDCPFRLYLTPMQAAAVCVGRVLCEKPDDAADASGGSTLHASCCLGTEGVHRLQPRRVRHFNHETQPAHFQSILASSVFLHRPYSEYASQIEFAKACVCKCLELANRYQREASVVLTDHKSADLIGALDDFNVEMRKNFCKRFRKL